jgi:hypothetical protein
MEETEQIITTDDTEYDTIEAADIPSQSSTAIIPAAAGKLVIPISRAGVIAGTVASTASYTITNAIIQATSVTADMTVSGIGYIMEKAASLVGGPTAELAVHGLRKVLAGTTRESISAQGPSTALIVSAVAGTGACITVTAGEIIARAAIGSVKKIAATITEKLKPTSETITDDAKNDNST